MSNKSNCKYAAAIFCYYKATPNSLKINAHMKILVTTDQKL